MTNPNLTSVALLVLVALPVSCKDSEQEAAARPKAAASGKPTVFVVNYPLRYFTERIAGDLVEVEFPAAGDGDPAFWKPTAEAVRRFQSADVIALNGATYAKWLATVSLPDAALVDTSKSFADRYIRTADTVTHSHGPGGKHSHAGTAFTTWLDPTLAIEHAKALHAALASRLPEHRELDDNLAALIRDLTEIDRQLSAAVASNPKRPLFGSHPVYQYLSRRYSLALESVHWEPDAPVTSEQWTELEKLRREHAAAVMLWEAEPLAGTVEKLDAMGIKSFVFAPCANVPASGDFLTVMRANVENLRRALQT